MSGSPDDDIAPGTISVTPCERGAVVTITRAGSVIGWIELPTDALENHIANAVAALIEIRLHNAGMGSGMGNDPAKPNKAQLH